MSTNLEIVKNSDYTRTFTVLDSDNNAINLSTYTLIAQIRRNHNSSEYVSFTMTVTDAINGKVSMVLPHAITDTLEGKYMYDIFLIDNTQKRYRIEDGLITIIPNISHVYQV